MIGYLVYAARNVCGSVEGKYLGDTYNWRDKKDCVPYNDINTAYHQANYQGRFHANGCSCRFEVVEAE